MNLETFFEQFNVFADAPNAVAKMRELVLQLAVRGKLVHQDPNDEPASVLLEHVRKAQRQLADKGSLKTKVHLPTVEADDQPYTIPESWLWIPLNELTELVYGKLLPTSELLPTGFPVFGANGIIGNYSSYHFEDEMLLISCRGAYSGKPNISPRQSYVTNNSIVCEFFEPNACDIRFYHAVISVSPRERIVTGSAQPQVTVGNAIKLPVPLPPLAEQKRIVAKVDELMALCDRLEAQQQERDTQHTTLARASLTRFADNPTPANLKFLFHRAYNITPADLRKSILTLAVQGKLVPQDPSDEPVEKTVRRNEELNGEAPFEISDQWIWTNLSQLAEINGGFAFKSTAYTEEGMRVVRISDFDEFGFKDHKIVRHPFLPDLQKFTLAEQNILMAMTGGTVGKSYFVRSMPEPMVVNQRVATIKVSGHACPSYVDIAIRSEMTQEVIRKAKNSTNDNISMGDIKGFAIPLPPLAEQRRIVAKVDELMALVDQLEAQLTTSRATAAKLMEAVVAELTRSEVE